MNSIFFLNDFHNSFLDITRFHNIFLYMAHKKNYTINLNVLIWFVWGIFYKERMFSN